VICPSLDSIRSLSHLVRLLRQVFRTGDAGIEKLAWRVYEAHPGAIDPAAIERANSIWGFDRELVIGAGPRWKRITKLAVVYTCYLT